MNKKTYRSMKLHFHRNHPNFGSYHLQANWRLLRDPGFENIKNIHIMIIFQVITSVSRIVVFERVCLLIFLFLCEDLSYLLNPAWNLKANHSQLVVQRLHHEIVMQISLSRKPSLIGEWPVCLIETGTWTVTVLLLQCLQLNAQRPPPSSFCGFNSLVERVIGGWGLGWMVSNVFQELFLLHLCSVVCAGQWWWWMLPVPVWPERYFFPLVSTLLSLSLTVDLLTH